MQNLPEHYFEDLEEKVCFQIELARLSPNLSTLNAKSFSTQNDLPANYFVGLEAVVLAQINEPTNPILQNQQQLSVRKTTKTVWWSLASGIAAAAIVVGVLVVRPDAIAFAEAENIHITPISPTTAALFAQISEQEAMTFLQENATNIEENMLEKHTQYVNINDFCNLKTDEISDFVHDNHIILED